MPRWMVVFVLLVSTAYACKCLQPSPETCPWAKPGNIAFVGTVLTVENPSTEDEHGRLHDDGSGTAHYRFQVEEALFGAASAEVDIYSERGGSDCSYHFKEGHKYLVFPYRRKDGKLFATFCNQTRGYSADDPLIAELRAARDHKAVASVFGELSKAISPYFGQFETARLPNVKIRLTGNDPSQRFEATTDAEGSYRLHDLPAGTYKIAADLPSGLELTDGFDPVPTLKFPANACYEMPLLAMPATRITGHLLDESGNIVHAGVELLQGASYTPESRGRWDFSRDEGYEFKNIVAGSYLLVFNIDNELDPSAPYPRTFYPGVTDPSKAVPVTIAEGQSVVADIHLSGRAPTRQLTVTLTWANSAPVENDLVSVRAKPTEGPEAGHDKVGPAVYMLSLLRGVRYTVWGSVFCRCSEAGCQGGDWIDTPETTLDVSELLPATLRLTIPRDACPK